MNKSSDKLLSRLFFSILPVQILIFAMGSINTIVDGTMAGRYIDSTAVGVIGLYYSMVNIMTAAGSVLLGGTTVLCGRYMGKGEIRKTEGIFSLNLTVTFIVGVILTACSLLVPGPIAVMLGSSDELKAKLVQYIVGYAIGIIPMLLAQQIASFLQMERQSTRGYIGVAGMIISNVALDIVLVGVLHMGIWGLALATSFSNLTYFIILAPYYFSKKCQLHYGFKKILWRDLGRLIKIGIPGALLVFCIALRGMVLNRILLKYSGNDGLSAMSSFNMICGFLIAYCLGNGSVVRMLTSVFVGEEDKHSMKKALKLVFTKGLLMSVVFTIFILLIAPFVTSIFFPDNTSNVYKLAYQLLMIYSACIPLILICQIFTNYLQATGHVTFVNIQSVFDGFFSMVIPSIILAPIMGAMGVWLANPIGIVLTILTVPLYNIIFWKRLPRNVDEVMFLRPSFGVAEGDLIDVPISDISDASAASEKIQNFCAEHSMGKKTAYFSALCLEEISTYIVEHGFKADKKKHSLNALSVFKDEKVILRIKDDCQPFDPKDMAYLTSGEDNLDNMGIRMVYDIADEVNYQNMLGMNVLTITIDDKNLLENKETDYLLEKRLRELSPELHTKFRNTVFTTEKILSNFLLLFPGFTDHSELHSMTVIDSCNRLIGKERINELNADEIFILLVGCYLHDVGMGIREEDFQEFRVRLPEKEFFEKNKGASKVDFVRSYHNEFSGFFVEKYADLFELPSKEHVFAVKQIVRGHRKTDLMDEKEYPSELRLPNGNTVCLPYLAALIRLSDEIDVVATRNPLVLFDIAILTKEIDIVETRKLLAVKSMMMTNDAFILNYETEDENVYRSLEVMVEKMQDTLDYCRDVVSKKSKFNISQTKVVLKEDKL